MTSAANYVPVENTAWVWTRTKAILVVLGIIIGAVITGLVLSLLGILGVDLATHTAPTSTAGTPTTAFLLAAGLNELGYAVFAIGLLTWKPNLLPSLPTLQRPTRQDGLWILGGLVIMLGGEYALTHLFAAFHVPTARNGASVAATSHASPLMFTGLIIISLVIIGPSEELLFRGLIQGHLRSYFSAPSAVLLASFLFAGVHVLAVQGSANGVLNTILSLFALALVLGIAYERTDSLLVPMVIHGCYDAILFAALGVSILH